MLVPPKKDSFPPLRVSLTMANIHFPECQGPEEILNKIRRVKTAAEQLVENIHVRIAEVYFVLSYHLVD